MEYHKRGNLGGAVGAVAGLIVGVGVSVLVLIFVGVLGGQTYVMTEPSLNAINSNAVASESTTVLKGIAVSLANNPVIAGTLSVKNGTAAVGLGNFTVNYPSGTLTLTGNAGYNNTALTAAYTWGDRTIPNYIKGSVLSSFQALNTVGDYLPIIVLAVIITLVMALILSLANAGTGPGNAL